MSAALPVIDRIAEFHADMTAWRRRLHAHPETAFEERRTAGFVAAKLGEFGIQVDRGLAVTGVVGTIEGGDGPAIGLRADMDALGVSEANDFAHRSTAGGKMHACGHDGHAAMLLGAARYLAETRRFKGTVHFIFQPAEEIEGGGRVMIEDGLFDKFPVDGVYVMHNWPGLPVGRFALRTGAMTAACDIFEITITGKGAHAAMPHLGADPIPAACEMVSALQTIVSRIANPVDSALLTVTRLRAGETTNTIPDSAVLGGTARSFLKATHDMIEARMRLIANHIAAAHGLTAEVRYERLYPSMVNHPKEAEAAAEAAAAVVGPGNVDTDTPPSMGAEDFAYMLEHVPGCYVLIGAGENSPPLHASKYDFNDEILVIGASYWARLVETVLGAPAGSGRT